MKRPSAAVACALFLAVLTPAASADSYPDRPIRIIVAFPPGGAADFSARILSQYLQPALGGQTIVIDNRGGGFGNIANDLTAKAAPDGYTLLITADATITINPSIHAQLTYDPQRDLTPVAMLITYPNVVVLNPAVPATSVRELTALAKTRALRYAHPGIGSLQQMAVELFKLRTGGEYISVPYKGGGPAIISLLGNETQVSFATPPSCIPHVKAGRLKAIAVTSAKRFAPLSDLPGMSEAGVTDYSVEGWIALFAPAKTPRRIVERLYQESAKILRMPEVKEKVLAGGAEAAGTPPDEARAIVRRETELWAKVVKTAGVKVE